MPNQAFLEHDLCCEGCGVVIAHYLIFGWGYCPGALPRFYYHLGDEIRWRRCQDGSVRPWTYFTAVSKTWEANIGDSVVTDLIIRDTFNWRDPGESGPQRCSQCGFTFGGAAVEIRGGHITRGWLYQPNEFPSSVDYFVYPPSGRLEPMPQWNDHVMDQISSC